MDTFPVARLGALISQNTHTVYRDVRHGKYGAPFKVAGRLHVKVAAVERAACRHFTYGELRAALAPPKVPDAPEPTNAELRTALLMADTFEAQHRNGLYTREEVIAIVEWNVGIRDIQWLQLQKRQMQQDAPECHSKIIPDKATIRNELDELKYNGDIL